MENLISIVSLGPGEADLITLKGYKTLMDTDVIYSPSTKLRDGSVSSRALEVIEELGVDKSKVILYHLPMSKDRTQALNAYKQVADAVSIAVKQNKKVAITAEGDAGFYSSSHYIVDFLSDMGIEVSKIPGIPAFIACGALGKIHLTLQEESLVVLAKPLELDELQRVIANNQSVVIMKASQSEISIKKVLRKYTNLHLYYFENVGFKNEFYTTVWSEIMERNFPYFSLLILKTDK